ncbi:hypothetical protein EMIHUDRAFT_456854, partial [Emiliania huxleyi CCMP1516]|uniref:Homeobox domain-containing protein n=2 Tax=Emiliania huxleyi TaxID=2903 RepID=A0A0D3JZT4_EMIH1
MTAPWYQQKRQKKHRTPPEPLDANSSSDTELQADDSDEGAAASLILLLDLPKQEASGSKGAPFNPRVPSRRPAARKGERWQVPPSHLAILEAAYLVSAFPSLEDRKRMASAFSVSPRQIQVWSRTNALGTLSSSRSTHVEGLPPPLPPPQPPLPPQPPPPPQWAGRLRRSRHCGSRRQCTRHCTSRNQRATAGRSRRRGGRPRCRRRRRRRRRLRRQRRRRRRRRRRRKSSPWLQADPHRRWMRRSQSLRGGRRCSRRPLRPLPSTPFGCPAASTPFRVYFL